MKRLRLLCITVMALFVVNNVTYGSQDIFIAIKSGTIDQVKSYIENGGDVNIKDENGRTLLIWASLLRDTNFARLLLDANADVNLTQNGFSALMAATTAGNLESIKLLINAHSEVNAKNIQGYTALIMAATNGISDIVSQLLAANADYMIKDNEGKTAFDWAIANGHSDIALMLTYPANPLISDQLNERLTSDKWAVTVLSIDNEGNLVTNKDNITGRVYPFYTKAPNISLLRATITLERLDNKPIKESFLSIGIKLRDTEGNEYSAMATGTGTAEFYDIAKGGTQSIMLPVQSKDNIEYVFAVPVGKIISKLIWPDMAPIETPVITANLNTIVGTKVYDNGEYTGEFSNDYRHGKGTYTWLSGKYKGDKYVGEWLNGKQNGYGTYTSANGDIYTGEWLNDKINGHGEQTWKNGDKYGGESENGLINGQGTYTWANGDVYVGEWLKDNRNGKGEKIFVNGDKYIGEWKNNEMYNGIKYNKEGIKIETYTDGKSYLIGEWQDNKKDGNGIYLWANGDKYVGERKNGFKSGQGEKICANGNKYTGEWENDKKNGQGTYTWANGDKYIGEWENDNRNGQGTYTWADGNKYTGEWKDDKKEGQGTFSWSNGNKYIGEWKNDNRNGQGSLLWSDGDKYAGEWKDDKKEGKGTYTWPDGDKYVGEWKDNKKYNGIIYNIEGKEISRYADGVCP